MRIVNLIENTKGAEGCLCEHGLSFYIETKNHKLLVDTGATAGFLANAKKLGIDLGQVDHAIISHGHYDHAGGLLAFAELNPKAKIWIQRQAAEEYYHRNAFMEKCNHISDRGRPDGCPAMGDALAKENHDDIPDRKRPDGCPTIGDALAKEKHDNISDRKRPDNCPTMEDAHAKENHGDTPDRKRPDGCPTMGDAHAKENHDDTPDRKRSDSHLAMNDTLLTAKYIGIDPQIKELSQVEWLDGDRRIDQDIFLFTHVTGRRLWPAGNLELKVKRDGRLEQDEFLHEQYLVLEEDGRRVLLSGCAHNGILNILDRYQEIYGNAPDVVISGFHMNRKSGYGEADLAMIRETGRELRKLHTRFYTGHCTGEIPYQILKEVMGEQLAYVHSGEAVSMRL